MQFATLDKAYEKGELDERIYKRIKERAKYITGGIDRIEKASGIKYPDYYIEPSIILVTSGMQEVGMLFARTISVIIDNKVKIIIQLSAPLIAFGLKGTIHAILAHEFLHYLEFLSRMIRLEIISDEISYTLFESKYSDLTRLLEPKAVFNDKALIRLLTKKFQNGLSDKRLEEKCIKLWIEKGYNTKRINIEDNVTRLTMDAIINTPIDDKIESQIKNMLARSEEIKRKRKKVNR